mmetsp:Transcript_24608/g.57049  ORF Transcript_24608/g.57049 Transcript_24608/m.57049 type:complete len:223 (+) Transcript_24608:1247-1915(+)
MKIGITHAGRMPRLAEAMLSRVLFGGEQKSLDALLRLLRHNGPVLLVKVLRDEDEGGARGECDQDHRQVVEERVQERALLQGADLAGEVAVALERLQELVLVVPAVLEPLALRLLPLGDGLDREVAHMDVHGPFPSESKHAVADRGPGVAGLGPLRVPDGHVDDPGDGFAGAVHGADPALVAGDQQVFEDGEAPLLGEFLGLRELLRAQPGSLGEQHQPEVA